MQGKKQEFIRNLLPIRKSAQIPKPFTYTMFSFPNLLCQTTFLHSQIFFCHLFFQELELDFILGYRGFDTRNNLHYSADGSLVYHASGAGIIHDTQTQSQSFYLEHTDDIICMCSNQNPKFKVIKDFKDIIFPLRI